MLNAKQIASLLLLLPAIWIMSVGSFAEAADCDTDKDCRASEWPGCPKAVNVTNFDKLNGTRDVSKKGKCEEPKLQCTPVPKTYCEEGVCAFKYPKDTIRLE